MEPRINTRVSASAIASAGVGTGAAATNVSSHGATIDPTTGATMDPTSGATIDPTAGATVDTGSIERVVGIGNADTHAGTAAIPTSGAGAASGFGGNIVLVADSKIRRTGAPGNPGAQAVVTAVPTVQPGVPIAPATVTVESALLTAIGTLQRELVDLRGAVRGMQEAQSQ